MCYNVLCDKYATRQLYGYCPNWALAWDYRRKALLDEIRGYNADLISLQEVETEKFYNFFQPELQALGYEGIFSPKSRAKTMSEKDRKHVDGCAIFYRVSKFTLVKEHLVEFNQLAMANAAGSDHMLNRVMTKDNIGLAALLQTKEAAFDGGLTDRPPATSGAARSAATGQPLLVCTAHMHWDPEFCDVKLIQTMMLVNELKRIARQAAASYEDFCQSTSGTNADQAASVPLVLCGDLNSLPHSAVVEFLSRGTIAIDHPDFKELVYKDCLRKLSSSPEIESHYSHPFRFAKAYPDDLMPYTNYTYVAPLSAQNLLF
jgi:CCR4-NOT transcription complex subunit 6